MDVNKDGEDNAALRAEVHFLAALVDELMRKLRTTDTLSQAEMNDIEVAVAKRVGGVPRAW